ncbi:RagB/SusD family nutrient uptake outer membrane protein [Seonamhaeicola sp.]|uniref:RagB/SusD family nutrient uptake outer membrane protein n=1 Tax=Seonamhaeicola sp. TaxID=1912245 RepID=UPI002611EF75|nr:RagB/SusD family nutrient uptake outer membrane protein [Seonamhaeicola sp.]
MKNLIFKKLALVLVIAIAVTSCEESFLDESNPISLSSETYFNTVSDLETGLISVYNALKNDNTLSIVNEYHRSDMTYPGFGRPNPQNSGSVFYFQNFDESSTTTNQKWAALYTGIFRANQVIVNCERLIPEFTGDAQEAAELVLAQARTLRGLFYFWLHSSYNGGSVPIYDFVPVSEADFYQEAQPEDVVQQFYLADLEYGMNNLPASYTAEQGIGRITKGAATALLGKSYLYDEDYAMAAQYFKSVIDDFDYALTPDIGSNFTTRDEFNEESILEISYSTQFKDEIHPASQEQVSTRLNYSFSPVGGWSSIYPSCWLTVLYQDEQVDTQDPRNTVMKPVVQNNGNIFIKGGNFERDSNDDIVYEEGLRDYSMRASASIAIVDDNITPYYLRMIPAQAANFGSGARYSWFRKYTNWDIATSEALVATSVQRSGVNVRIVRLADVFLMYAEALIQGGTDESGVEEAMIYINKVRRRSGVVLLGLPGTGEYPDNDHDNVTYNAQNLMEHLMYVERPLELCVEGHAIRTIDLRRWGITKQRFEDLATRRYWRGHYEYENTSGNRATRWSSRIATSVLFPQNANYVDPYEVWNEYEDAAINYTEADNAYWPLPNDERVTNPFIDGGGN